MPDPGSTHLTTEDPTVVVMHPALVDDFKAWLAARDLHLAGPIPTPESEAGTDLPFYVIGIGAR